MKKVIVILTVGLVSLGLGYWIGQMKTFADGVVNDIGKYELKTDSTGRIRKGENFDDFIYHFIRDSLFQLDRINFPLKSVQSDLENVDSTRIKRKDWKTVRLFGAEEYKAQIYDNFKKELRDTDERLFCWEGIDNGINVQYKFARIGGLWYLIEYNDFSD